MTPRRRQTTLPEEQPVRFYKAVALTFLCFTVILLGVIIFMSAKRATIVIETKSTPVDVTGSLDVVAGDAAGPLPGSAVSSSVFVIDERISPETGREESAVARGTVTLHNETAAAQALVATTRLLSPDGVLFRLTQRVLVPANGTVDAEVYADAAGSGGEIAPTTFTIPGLSADKQKTIYAKSDAAMAGGTRTVGIFGSEDKKKAEKRMTERLLAAARAHFEDGAPSGQGVAVQLLQYAVSFDAEVDKEVSEVRVTGRGTAVAVFYDKQLLRQSARAMLEKRVVDESEIVVPRQADPTVTIEEYDPSAMSVRLKVFFDGIANLNPESPRVGKSVFFGKTRDEIRRYALSLDHVQSAEVDFSPAWILRVPHSAEQVQVVVKNVE
ncbi:MAG: hypothetical protein WC822_05265 [Candidatus Paceibacterota bacterium]|jgi:hypothetical protein